MIERKYEAEAASVADAIRHFSERPEALDNFECYISIHFPIWLEKYASTPGELASEFDRFSRMYDEEGTE